MSSPSGTMAPSCLPTSDYSKLSNKGKHKNASALRQLRKPVVEKMRRDRINNCIEQLRVMLEKEFHQQDRSTKLEKADILEMTVVFLKQQLQAQGSAPQKAHCDGYSQCWKANADFLSPYPKLDVTLPELKRYHRAAHESPLGSSQLQEALVKQEMSVHRAVWRPWSTH